MSRGRHRARGPVAAVVAALALAGAACGPGPSDLPELPLLYVGNVWGGNLAVFDHHVFFTVFYHGDEQDQAVMRVPADGGQPVVLWHGAANEPFGRGMAINHGQVFFAEQDGDSAGLFSVPINPGDRASLGRFTTVQAPDANLVVDDSWIFAASATEIVRAPRAGGEVAPVHTGRVAWIDRRSGPLYFVGDGVLVRLDAASGVVTPIAQIPGAVTVAVTDDTAYVGAADAVWAMPLAGGVPTKILTGIGAVENIVAGTGELFIAVQQDLQHAVLRYPLGGEPSPIFHTRAVAPSMVVADGSLFLAFCCEDLASTSGGQVVRLDL